MTKLPVVSGRVFVAALKKAGLGKEQLTKLL